MAEPNSFRSAFEPSLPGSASTDGSGGEAALEPLLKKARVQRADGQFTKAATAYLQVLQIEPGHAAASLELADMLFRDLKQPERSLKYFDLACRLDPDNDVPVKGKAEVLVLMGRVEDARTTVARFAQTPATTARGWLNRGIVLQSQGDNEAAEKAFLKAAGFVRIDPSQHESSCRAMFQLAHLLTWLDRDSEAIDWYSAYIKLRPKDQEAWRGYAAVLNALGQHDAAVDAIDRYRKLIPTASWPLISLARIFGVDCRHPDRGLRYLDRFERLEQGAAEMAYAAQVRGEIEEARGDPRAALEAFERSAKLNDRDPRTYYCLARVLDHLGQKARARKMAERAAALGPDQTTFALALNRLDASVALTDSGIPSVKAALRRFEGS